VRGCNEDDLLLLAEAGVFAVADGLGGLDAGDIASKTALQNLKALSAAPAASRSGKLRLPRFGTGTTPPLEEIIALVNTRTYEQKIALARNMATTLAMVRLEGEAVAIAHVGDSRVYHWRDSVLSRLTSDHSLVNELYKQGALTASQAEHSPQRHVITRALGAEATVRPSVQQKMVLPGDILLLCTDGLTAMLPDTRIAEIIQDLKDDVGRAAEQLVRAANEAGGHDNITVILLAMNRLGKRSQ
jgi:protein phosphatase